MHCTLSLALLCWSALMVVGQSAPFTGLHSQIGTDVRAGILAAFALANETSYVKFALSSLDDGYEDARQAANMQTLLCTGANGLGPAFAITGNAGSSASEASLAVLKATVGLGEAPVPYIGGITNSELLRDRSAVLQNASYPDPMAYVALTRAGGGDEISAIVSLLSSDWDVLTHTSLFYQNSGVAMRSIGYLDTVLQSFATSLYSSSPVSIVSSQAALADMATKAADTLCAKGDPKAVVLVANANMCGALLQEMAKRQKRNVLYVAMSWITAEDVYPSVPAATWRTLSQLGTKVYFTQVVPNPNASLKGEVPIVSEFREAMDKYQPHMNRSHATLEGYISARLITAATARALELSGWPLTRAALLDAIFRDVRTFKLRWYTLGPYGDGVGTDDAKQTVGDWCNQGAHEVFMTSMDLGNGTLTSVPSWSFKFTGCTTSGWNSSAHRAVVAYENPATAGEVSDRQLGLTAAINAHNSDNAMRMALTAVLGRTLSNASAAFTSRKVVAITGLDENETDEALVLNKAGKFFPYIAPLSGLSALRTRSPFKRWVINLFPSYYQEVRTAADFLITVEKTAIIYVLWNSRTHNGAGTDFQDGLMMCLNRHFFLRNVSIEFHAFTDVSNSTEDATSKFIASATDGNSFIIVASADDTSKLLQITGRVCPKCPVVIASTASYGSMFVNLLMRGTGGMERVYRTSLTPPLAMLSSGNALRQDFESWVSSNDQIQVAFEGFFIGRFLSAVIESIEEDSPKTVLSADSLLDAIYSKKYFKIDNKITVGPFLDQDSGEKVCNQGMDTVYITKWDLLSWDYVDFSLGTTQRCGTEFDPPPASSSDNTERTIILATTIPGFVIACALLIVAFMLQRRGRTTLKKLKRSELEIGERIGKGLFGTVHNGDWHGTPVAIRVIDKSEITREDLSAIKSEMLLTHSLHHPNLLMMLGYSESNKDLLIVSEYMAAGSLHEYLKKNKQNMNYYNQVAIAFIDGSMVTKICDFWCSSGKHSTVSNSARRRSNWLAPELIEGKPATTATDVFAFGVVLWELFLPSDLYLAMSDSSKSSSVSHSHSHSVTFQGGMDMPAPLSQHKAIAQPEIHPSTPKEVATLLQQCWQKEPQRRPSVFQILRSWPQTFAAIGAFEMPTDLSLSSPAGGHNILSEVSMSTDAREGPDDEFMAAVLPQDLSSLNAKMDISGTPGRATIFPLEPEASDSGLHH
eukprot:m51a1_g3865 putative serine threonine protein (1207) ;mRNA; r:419741-424034